MRKILVLFSILLISMSGFAVATPVNTQLTLEELTENATIIFTGKVVEITGEWNEDKTQIYTFITISVDEKLKGIIPGENITIKQLGGTTEIISLYTTDAPQFKPDEEVLLFIRPGFIPFVGMSQGKFTIENDRNGNKIVLENGIPLDEFTDRVKSLVNDEHSPVSFFSSFNPGILRAASDDFRIIGINPAPSGYPLTISESKDKPPFLHWDLREFSDCKVPWSISDNITDLNEDGNITDADKQLLINEINTSFKVWEDVVPSAIGFRKGKTVNVSNRAIRLDGHNVLDWATVPVKGDDIQAINFSHGKPNVTIITAGINGIINTTPAGDDKTVGNTITAGSDGIASTNATGDDIQKIPFGQGEPNSTCITAGSNGFLETQPVGDDIFDITNNRILSGKDGVVQTKANNLDTTNYVALTGIFYEKNGKIIESDVVFDTSLNWTIGRENSSEGAYDVQVTAIHEIGHFIGIHHSPVAGPPVSTMHGSIWPDDLSKRSLEDSDKNAANFLYTPDLGDAPDPFTGQNQYPSIVHDGSGRTLNGIQLLSPARGAEHLFGYQPAGHAFEWLGGTVETAGDRIECEAKVTDKDEHDDGVRFVNFTDIPGKKFKVIVNVSTSGMASRYGVNDMLYLNAWIDWDSDGRWTQFEQIIEWKGGPGLNDSATKGKLLNPATPWPSTTNSRELEFEVTVPSYTIPTYRLEEPFYSRFRLDYDENIGESEDIDGTLEQDKGAAQFGEVEDYRHDRIREVPILTKAGLISLIFLLCLIVIGKIKHEG
ncbi:matrixin family metalloprotease [Methanolobus sp. ZRKC3]|uniref:matrixin family metalloprotease n=1 Tax=Methanolobus sp. ZRKC3 TaxID=3125786 RepID=UPI00325161C7